MKTLINVETAFNDSEVTNDQPLKTRKHFGEKNNDLYLFLLYTCSIKCIKRMEKSERYASETKTKKY